VEKFVGVKGVAEPAAVLASNGGKLLIGKVKRGNLTVAAAWIVRSIRMVS
jgi:cobalt-precorrin 5A hydrolase